LRVSFTTLCLSWSLKWSKRLSIILEFKDSIHKVWHVEVYLKEGVEVAGVSNILQTTWDSIFSFTLLWIQRFIRARIYVFSILIH
jgi:hypothetical protein